MSVNIDPQYPNGIAVNRWVEPIEAFVSCEHVNPIKYEHIDDADFSDCDVSSNEVILAHETTQSNAESITDNGFDPSEDDMCSIREESVFGWLFKEDIGHHQQNVNDSIDSVVLFKADKDKTYLSSYRSSAHLLAMGIITSQEYEDNYVMSYEEFEETIMEHTGLIEYMDYDTDWMR